MPPKRKAPTAKKTTGGKSSRQKLDHNDATAAPISPLTAPAPTPPNADSQEADAYPFCMLCNDGGDQIECCDCRQGACAECIPDANSDEVKEAIFQCPLCFAALPINEGLPYQGFKDLNGTPVGGPNMFTTITPRANRGFFNRLTVTPTCIIFIRLKGWTFSAAPDAITLATLKSSYFPHHDEANESGVALRKYEFDLSSDRGKKKYNKDVAEILELVPSYNNVVVYLATHSDPTYGGLWYKALPTPQSSDAGDVFSVLFPPALSGVLKVKNTILVLFTCGGVMAHEPPRKAVKMLSETTFKAILAFGALDLQPYAVTPFVVRFVESLFMDNRTVDSALNVAMADAGGRRLGSHTNIWSFASGQTKLHAWFYDGICPRGVPRPFQCAHCGVLRRVKLDAAALAVQEDKVRFSCGACSLDWTSVVNPLFKNVQHLRAQEKTPTGRWVTVDVLTPVEV